MHDQTTRSRIGIAAAVVLLPTAVAMPAAAQYGDDGMTFFVTPARVPVDQAFSGAGEGCDAGSTVEITVDGVDGVVATVTASADGTFSHDDIAVPEGLLPGTDQDVRAACGTESAVALVTLVCPDGEDPVEGSCEDGAGETVGSLVPTTTTTAPDDGVGTTTGGDGGDSSPLAFTGAAFTGLLLQGAMTLIGLGGLLSWAARRRLNDDASGA